VIGNAEEILREGSAILDPLLAAHGFVFHLLGSGSSSGGAFAFGEFRKDGRRLELHFRASLGMVAYHLAGCSMSHVDYIRSVLAPV
jgi:hypothetical protein